MTRGGLQAYLRTRLQTLPVTRDVTIADQQNIAQQLLFNASKTIAPPLPGTSSTLPLQRLSLRAFL